MATLTLEHSRFDNGSVVMQFDVNDANWRVSRVRCINNSGFPAIATIFDAGQQVFVQPGWVSVDGGIMMGAYAMHVRRPS